MSNSLVVYKGDDTAGEFGRHLQFTIKAMEGMSLEGCTARFTVHNIEKTWTDITPGQKVEIVYTHDETAGMPVGAAYGVFRIIDRNGCIRTFEDSIPFLVTDDIRQVYPCSSSVTVIVGQLVKWGDIQKPFTSEDEFDMLCSDWKFRKCVARLWKAMGGSVINDD